MITRAQYDFLTLPLDGGRVGQRQGQSHLEAWDVRRHLIRVFGFGGFDIETIRCDLVKEIESPPGAIKYRNGNSNDRTVWTVVYRAEVRLSIKAPDGSVIARYEDGATGDANNLPSCGDAHDFAMKTALSQALKRCAVNLGDAFGLALYNGGRTDAVVLQSLVTPEGVEAAPPPANEAPVQPEPAAVPAEPEPAAQTPTAPTAPDPNAVRDWALQPDRTADGVDQALARLHSEHPAVAAAVVVNENGDEEQLQVLLARRARELTPAGAEPPPGRVTPGVARQKRQQVEEERRRKRMHALWNDLGYGRDANRAQRLAVTARVIGREVGSTSELTYPEEVERVITALEQRQQIQTRELEGAAA